MPQAASYPILPYFHLFFFVHWNFHILFLLALKLLFKTLQYILNINLIIPNMYVYFSGFFYITPRTYWLVICGKMSLEFFFFLGWLRRLMSHYHSCRSLLMQACLTWTASHMLTAGSLHMSWIGHNHIKGIVHFEIKIWYLSAYPKGIQDVGVFFSSVDPILMFLGQTVLVCQSYNGRYRSLSL